MNPFGKSRNGRKTTRKPEKNSIGRRVTIVNHARLDRALERVEAMTYYRHGKSKAPRKKANKKRAVRKDKRMHPRRASRDRTIGK